MHTWYDEGGRVGSEIREEEGQSIHGDPGAFVNLVGGVQRPVGEVGVEEGVVGACKRG